MKGGLLGAVFHSTDLCVWKWMMVVGGLAVDGGLPVLPKFGQQFAAGFLADWQSWGGCYGLPELPGSGSRFAARTRLFWQRCASFGA